MSESFWLSDEQFGRLAPLLPTDTRGVPRVDDRRVISGIIHVLQSGCRWRDAPAEYGPHKTLYNRFVRWARKGVWQGVFVRLADSGGPPAAVMLDSTHVKAHRSAAGGKGGRDPGDRPLAGRAHDQDPCRRRRARPGATADRRAGHRGDAPMAAHLIGAMAPGLCIADTAYDSDALRDLLLDRGTIPVIPNNPTRKRHHPFDRQAYRLRNVIERAFARLKDWRRIATRYDKLALTYTAAAPCGAILLM